MELGVVVIPVPLIYRQCCSNVTALLSEQRISSRTAFHTDIFLQLPK